MSYTANDFGGKEIEYKRMYAQYIAEGLSGFNAALKIFGTGSEQAQFAFWCFTRWEHDEWVIEEIGRAKAEKKLEFEPPTKVQMAKEIYDRAKSFKAADDYVKAMRLVGDMLGYIEKAAPNTAVQVNVVEKNPVMIVRELGDEETWERETMAQQRKLKQLDGNATTAN